MKDKPYRPYVWSRDEENWTIEHLTDKIRDLQESIDLYNHKNNNPSLSDADHKYYEGVINMMHRGRQHLMAIRAKKIGK